MDKRFSLVDGLDGFSKTEKDVYKYMLTEFEKLSTDENGDYTYTSDKVEDIDQQVLQQAANEFNMTVEEVDRIYLAIENVIYD